MYLANWWLDFRIRGVLKSGKKIDVKGADGKTTEYSADHIVIATGARSRELPSLPQDGKKVIGYREAMTLPVQRIAGMRDTAERLG